MQSEKQISWMEKLKDSNSTDDRLVRETRVTVFIFPIQEICI